nr:MAG TPA: hypothetical protein [Caudoviricetes sp.]
MGKQSAFAKAVQREVNIQLQLYGRNRMQLAEDAAFMAANEVLGLGSCRYTAFRTTATPQIHARPWRG